MTRRCRRTSRRTIVEGPTRRREKADGGSRLVPTFRAERACPRGVSATKEEPVSRRQRARSARGAGLDGDGPSAVPRGDGRSATLGEMQSNCWTRFRGGSPNPTPGSGQTSPGPLSQDRSRSCPIRSFDQATAVTAPLMAISLRNNHLVVACGVGYSACSRPRSLRGSIDGSSSPPARRNGVMMLAGFG